jgi:hypothetical protein
MAQCSKLYPVRSVVALAVARAVLCCGIPGIPHPSTARCHIRVSVDITRLLRILICRQLIMTGVMLPSSIQLPRTPAVVLL